MTLPVAVLIASLVAVAAALAIAFVSALLMLPLCPFGDWILAQVAPSEAVLGLERAYYDVMILGAGPGGLAAGRAIVIRGGAFVPAGGLVEP